MILGTFMPAKWTGTDDESITSQFDCYRATLGKSPRHCVWLIRFKEGTSANGWEFTVDMGQNSGHSYTGRLPEEYNNETHPCQRIHEALCCSIEKTTGLKIGY